MNPFNFFEGFSCSFKSLIQDRVIVSDGHKACFKGAWSQVNTIVKHSVEESLKSFCVAFHNIFETCRACGAEVNTEHTACALAGESDSFFFGNFNQPADKFGSLNGESVVEARFLNSF